MRSLLDSGTSLDDIIASLAGSLASSVAAQLGIAPDVAKQRLTHVLGAALAPVNTGPPQTHAERARTLAQRFRQIAELATRVTNGDPGQSIRTIAGTSLDAAPTAKATPAPSTDSIVRDATNALAAPVSPVPARSASVTTGDDKRVAVDPGTAIAAGGDTLLGRTLTRALRSAQPPPAPVDGAGRGADLSGTATKSAHVSTASAASVLDGFVRAFVAAIERERGTAPAAAHAATAAANLPSPAPAGTATTPATAFALPGLQDATSVIAPSATAPAHAPHVDANAVIDQVLRGVSVHTDPGSSEVKLRLVPDSLGDVTVKLVVSGGSVDATITAGTPDAQNALAGAQQQLARALADAGLKLQSFTVGLAGGFANGGDGSPSQQHRSYASARRVGGVGALQTDDQGEDELLAVPSFGPPIYAASPARGYNYLV